MTEGFYKAFEDKYRGTSEVIKFRQTVYIPFIKPLLSLDENHKAIDLGCGRGEWLEILQELGFDPLGIDLDIDMLNTCRGKNLKVHSRDAVAFLKELPENSHTLISGFHIVEHIPFENLQILVQEALRVLIPGGLLILETPNPENITVGASNFYIDPTHNKPIPPPLLAFLPEYYGYKRIKILRLQESSELKTKERINLIDVIAGVSPDYSIVAQKNANNEILLNFEEPFSKSYGIDLSEIANRYDKKIEFSISTLLEYLNNLNAQNQELTSQNQELKSRVSEITTLNQECRNRDKEIERLNNQVINPTAIKNKFKRLFRIK